MVWVAEDELARLKARDTELQALQAELPAMLEKAKHEGGMDRLKMLHQKQRENPEKHREMCRRQYQENKEKINAKRREAYRLKQAARGAGMQTPELSVRTDGQEISPEHQ
jgi:hypothetical protein